MRDTVCMAKKKTRQPLSAKCLGTSCLDCPDNMSLYEGESLAAEAILAARKKKKKRPKALQGKVTWRS